MSLKISIPVLIILTFSHGISMADTLKHKKQNAEGCIKITNLYFSDGTSLKDHILMSEVLNQSNEIRLRPDESTFKIYWAPMDSISDSSAKYSWLLEGYTNKWSVPNKNKFASFSNIPAGTYYLKIKMLGNSKNLTNKTKDTCIKIIVSQPFIKSLSFRFLLGSACLSLIVISIFAYFKITK